MSSRVSFRLFQRLLDHLIDLLNVLARGDLGNHSAVQFVQIDLGGNNVGQHRSLPLCTTAAAVSSQEVSIARILISLISFIIRAPQSSNISSADHAESFPAFAVRKYLSSLHSMYCSGRVRDGL